MTSGKIQDILNHIRPQIQAATADVGEAQIACAFLLHSFLLDEAQASNVSIEMHWAYLAHEMPAEAERMGMRLMPITRN